MVTSLRSLIYDESLIEIIKNKKMDQKENSEEKISRVISEAVELIISWVRGKNNG